MKNLLLLFLIFCFTSNYQQAIGQDITPKEAGDYHTLITEITFNKLTEWESEGYSQKEIFSKLYDDVFIEEFSVLTGFKKEDIKGYLRKEFNLTKSNINKWSIDGFLITDKNSKALYDDLITLVNSKPTKKEFARKILTIREKHSPNFGSKELDAVIEITNSSFYYWTDNLESWIDIDNSKNYLLKSFEPDPCQKEKIVGGDIKGAIGGLVATIWSGLGAIGGAVTGAMVGTLIGAVDAAIRCPRE